MKFASKKNNQKNSSKNDERYRELDNLVQEGNGSRLGGGSCLGKCAHVFKLIFKEIKDNIFIYILSIIYLSVCVMNKIFAKRTLNKIGNYSFVTSETHNFICMIMFFIVYSLFGNKKGNSKERHRSFNLQFFAISMLDACSVILAFIGLTRTTGNIQSFVLQLIIIVVTIALVEMKLSFETQEENSIIFNLVLISALIPVCFSNMTREIVFKKYKIDILRLNAMVSFFQLFTSCLILPVYTLPFLKQLHLPYNEIWTNIKNGFACLFLGRNTVVENCGLGMAKLCDDCDGAWKTFALFSFFNICDNLITSYIIDKFSTMTYTIVSCIQGPAIAIAYYFKFLAGDVVREPRLLDFVTLVRNIILERKKMRNEENEDSEGELTNVDSIITQ
ncbi:chloroquine resistance transporter [Plasmodium falciparum CAMP/Malaysia]|uniref:Chloroquine resistance transporter n=1 Tax=Plasmodium falciparum (isolate Camp / Malaysia) TaxID=5835 RepID=A0A024XAB8_PLAFC|nr:chloroquine resistance transporter [Plasmodium falciparum CAMP/Malaysia]